MKKIIFFLLIATVVFGQRIRPSEVKGYMLEDSTITADKIATGVITSANVADSSITSAKIADGAVGYDKFDNATQDSISNLPAILYGSTTATVRAIAENKEYVNVVDAGAVNDSSASVRTVFNAIIAAKRNMKLPPGKYRLDADLTTISADSMVISGDGRETTKIYYGGSNAMIEHTGGRLILKDLTIYTLTGTTAILGENGTGITIDNCRIVASDTNQASLVNFSGGTNYIYNSIIENNQDENGTTNSTINHNTTYGSNAVTKIYSSVLSGQHYVISALANSATIYVYNSNLTQLNSSSGDVINCYANTEFFIYNSDITFGNAAVIMNRATDKYNRVHIFNSIMTTTSGSLYKSEGTQVSVDSLWIQGGNLRINGASTAAVIPTEGLYLSIKDFEIEADSAYVSDKNKQLFNCQTSLATRIEMNDVELINIGLGYFSNANITAEFDNVKIYNNRAGNDAHNFYINAGESFIFKRLWSENRSTTASGSSTHVVRNGVDSLYFYDSMFITARTEYAIFLYNPLTVFVRCDFKSRHGVNNYDASAHTVYFQNCNFQINTSAGLWFYGQNTTHDIVVTGCTWSRASYGNATLHTGSVSNTTNFVNDSLKVDWQP